MMKNLIIKISIRLRGYYVDFEKDPCTAIDDYRPPMTIYHPNGDIILNYDFIPSLKNWFLYHWLTFNK